MADDEPTQSPLSGSGGGAFNWGAADSARRENIAQGHARIRDRVRQGQLFNTANYEQKPKEEAPGWGTAHGRPNYPGQGEEPQPQHEQGQLFDPDDASNTWKDKPQSKLGAMFSDPAVRNHVERISNSWETSNLIRKGGVHAAIRHAVGLKQFSSHPNDEIRAATRRLNNNPNAGMDPGHFQTQDSI
jgi:hypothetical protein